MCSCLLNIGMLIMGIVALIKGEIKLTKSKVVKGSGARIIGGILMIPLPAQFLFGMILGFTMAASGKNPQEAQQEIMGYAIVIDVAITGGCALLAIVLGVVLARPPAQPSSGQGYDYGNAPKSSNNPYEPPANPFA